MPAPQKRERHKGFNVRFNFLLPRPLKPIEASVSKIFGVSFNKLFGRFHCGGVGFVKLLKGNLVFLQVCCVDSSRAIKVE